jgi:hypothetical protein
MTRYVTVEQAAQMTGYSKCDIVDAIRQDALKVTTVAGAQVFLKDGSWIAHMNHMRINPADLDTHVREGDFYNRHALLASIVHDPFPNHLARTLRVWRGAVLDKPSCRVALEVVSILEDALPKDDDDE